MSVAHKHLQKAEEARNQGQPKEETYATTHYGCIPVCACFRVDKCRTATCFLQDNGQGRRLGTLVVWADGGIAADEPLLAVPINLSVVLDLPQDKA